MNSIIPQWQRASLKPIKHDLIEWEDSNHKRVLFVGSKAFATARSNALVPARRIFGDMLAVDIGAWIIVTKAEFDPLMIAELPLLNWWMQKRYERQSRKGIEAQGTRASIEDGSTGRAVLPRGARGSGDQQRHLTLDSEADQEASKEDH